MSTLVVPGFRYSLDGAESFLDAREIGRDFWRLLAPLEYQSALVGTVIVPAGFLTDLESVPRWIPFAYSLVHGFAKRAAVVHDWFYQMRTIARELADAVFHEAMTALEVWGPRAWAMWVAVRAAGWTRWQQASQRRVALAARALEAKTTDFA